jgi:hypothetical protein
MAFWLLMPLSLRYESTHASKPLGEIPKLEHMTCHFSSLAFTIMVLSEGRSGRGGVVLTLVIESVAAAFRRISWWCMYRGRHMR